MFGRSDGDAQFNHDTTLLPLPGSRQVGLSPLSNVRRINILHNFESEKKKEKKYALMFVNSAILAKFS